MYDERLVRAAQEGDEAAFAALYDRAVDSVYDLAWSITGDAGEAARLVQAAFVLAARNLEQLTDPSQVRPWLLAIAGDQALADDQEGVLLSGWDAQSAAHAGDEPLSQVALRRWMSEAAAVLALPDQLVLELQLRHDLDPDQLAAAVGTTPAELPGVLERVDAEATAVLGALALARQGRKSCAGLA
ncbi:MAG: RNA polymerase sigma factor, partial [Acidimicrobiales bacterium]